MSGIPSDADQAAHHHDIIIIVNAQEKTVTSREVSYSEVVSLAYPTPPAPGTIFTVLYENAVKPNHEGSLVAGQVVTVKEKGTIFDVTPTSKS